MMDDIPLEIPAEMRPAMVRVFCSKPMQFIHRHPHVMEVPGQSDKPHLGMPHEHRVTVTAYMLCDHLERDKDLLLLHYALELATEFPKRVDMGTSSFEQICIKLRERIMQNAHIAVISAIKIETYDEGAEIVWLSFIPDGLPISATPLPVPAFLRKST